MGIKISALTETTSPATGDYLPILSGGQTKKSTLSNILSVITEWLAQHNTNGTHKAITTPSINVNSAGVIANISTGSYTPTLSNVTNIASSTAFAVSWLRVGNLITCQFYVSITPTAGAPTRTTLTFDFPVACNSTPVCAGSCGAYSASQKVNQVGTIFALSASSAQMDFTCVNTTGMGWYGTFQYLVN